MTENKYAFEIRVVRIENPAMSFPSRFFQKRMFRGVINFLCQSMKIDRSKYTDEQLNQDIQVFGVEGTKSECDDNLEKVEHIERKSVNRLIDTFANVRYLPSGIRHKLNETKIQSDDSGYQWLVATLLLFGINLSCSVEELK